MYLSTLEMETQDNTIVGIHCARLVIQLRANAMPIVIAGDLLNEIADWHSSNGLYYASPTLYRNEFRTRTCM